MLRFSLVITAFLASSCVNNSNDGQALEYKITAIPITKLDNSGRKCGNAEGKLSLENTKVFGKVTDIYERTFSVVGRVNDAGQVSGGYAVTRENVAKFQGEFNSSGGKGTWQDIFKCSGKWVAKKI